jgi:lipoprotein NlpD
VKKGVWIALASVVTILSGCSSVSTMAPIEDRTGTYNEATKPAKAESYPIEPAEVAKGTTEHLAVEKAPVDSGRVHVVSAGDTLYNIGVRYGVNPRELQTLNAVKDPTALSIGQELRIPATGTAAGEASSAIPSAEAGAASATATESALQSAPTVEKATRPETAEEAGARKIAEQKAARDAAARGEIQFPWPAKGDVIATFKETKKGIDIAGAMGDPVYAVLDGTVQYVGGNAPGYGNFVIVRHNIRLPGKGNTPLITVYGNASKILVRVNESVRAGQQIAEMGNTDADRVKLRFEVRQGKPLDPIPYLSE